MPFTYKPAKNKFDAKSLFYSRAQYVAHALDFEDPSDFYKYIDFWYRKELYGKIDINGTAIYNLQKSSLKQLVATNSKTLFAIDFVADAFEDMRKQYDSMVGRGQLEKEIGTIKEFEPHRAWKSVFNEYQTYMNEMKDYFIEEYLIVNNDRLKNFEDIMKQFKYFFFNHAKDFPMSLSSFALSNLCPMHVSGLIIEILDADHGNDEAKLEIIQSDSFETFVTVARKHGFYINKNAPWALVADITSPIMRRYMKPYGVEDPEDYFKEYCHPLHLLDISKMREFFLDIYYTFSNTYKFYQGTNICNKRLKRTTFVRNVLTIPEIDSILTEKYWMDFYIDLRLYETDTVLHPKELDRLKTRVDLYRSKFDRIYALKYVDEYFKKRDGRITDVVQEESADTSAIVSPPQGPAVGAY